jgi:hypothetical protein
MNDADWIKFLLGVIFTMLCSGGSYLLGARGKMTTTACKACQDICKREMAVAMDYIRGRQAELSTRQDEFDDDVSRKLDLVFSMLRA